MAICKNFLESAIVMKDKGLLISPQPGANELQGGGLDGLICVLLCENMADGGSDFYPRKSGGCEELLGRCFG